MPRVTVNVNIDVLADFNGGMQALYGKRYNQLSDVEQANFWKEDARNEEFFMRLPVRNGGLVVLNELLAEPKKWDIRILASTGSASADEHYPILEHRTYWLRSLNLNATVSFVGIAGTRHIAHFFQQDSVLIDTSARRCVAWTDRGGLGLPFVETVENIEELIRLLGTPAVRGRAKNEPTFGEDMPRRPKRKKKKTGPRSGATARRGDG